MRLTAQAITDAPIIINPLGEAVLQLRGLKIPYIENLGVSKDMYSVIDLVDNLIIEVKNIPKLKNLKCLLLARNNIVSVTQKTLGENLPNLNSITLTNNNLRNFRSIRGLFSCPALQEISLVDNDVTQQQNYRLILVWLIPTLKVLDFAKVKDRERKSAAEKYGTKQDPTEQGGN